MMAESSPSCVIVGLLGDGNAGLMNFLAPLKVRKISLIPSVTVSFRRCQPASLAGGMKTWNRFVKRALPFLLISAASASEAPLSYAFDVRPILSDRCFGCHGPDADKGREAGLRLDTPEGATAKLESGARAIVPGDLKASAMVGRIRSHDPEEIMPPAKLNRPLTDAERDILIRWIEQGAVYERHWAFVAPKKHEPPAVKDAGWCKDDIDRFVLGKLEKEKLSPNPEADRATLLRRAALTLTGLPPSPEQVQAFIGDAAPDAYEKQVDALLASPRYGERLAQDWLDVARFADTYGYQSDLACFVWPWRDWVINAFNSNLSYDKFATWQIAGDLLPEATQDQRLATMFNRLHRQTQEGGSIEAEFRQENVSDRVHTFGTAFLGLTMECAKCHDHKYDPIPQSDYYSMASMFGQIDECGLYPFSLSTSAPEPSMRLQQPHHGPEIAKRRAVLDAAEKDDVTGGAGRRADRQLGGGPGDPPLPLLVRADDGTVHLEVVEVLRVDDRHEPGVPHVEEVVDHPRGRVRGVVPPLERRHEHR